MKVTSYLYLLLWCPQFATVSTTVPPLAWIRVNTGELDSALVDRILKSSGDSFLRIAVTALQVTQETPTLTSKGSYLLPLLPAVLTTTNSSVVRPLKAGDLPATTSEQLDAIRVHMQSLLEPPVASLTQWFFAWLRSGHGSGASATQGVEAVVSFVDLWIARVEVDHLQGSSGPCRCRVLAVDESPAIKVLYVFYLPDRTILDSKIFMVGERINIRYAVLDTIDFEYGVVNVHRGERTIVTPSSAASRPVPSAAEIASLCFQSMCRGEAFFALPHDYLCGHRVSCRLRTVLQVQVVPAFMVGGLMLPDPSTGPIMEVAVSQRNSTRKNKASETMLMDRELWNQSQKMRRHGNGTYDLLAWAVDGAHTPLIVAVHASPMSPPM